MDYKFLDKINSPQDVKELSLSEIPVLCDEIRDCIINTVSKNGGHLASNLGTVELTVAIHRAFNSPKDAIIFDVGHQSYTHKLLTGRFKDFSSIRNENGLSGFMRPKESIYDPFVTGHSSNSISAAYGIYKAKSLCGEEGTAVAVIGDGALTGGMAYEALNNVGSCRNRLIIILNDNKMSISRNVGAVARLLTKMRNKPKYHYFKFAVNKFLRHIPVIGEFLAKVFFSVKEFIKSIVYRNNIFKGLGINYLGPVNGHDVTAMESLFKVAQNYQRPTLIHVITTKGKGFDLAEHMPKDYHGVSPFDIKEGQAKKNTKTFSSVAGETLCEIAFKDKKICAVTAAMTEGTGLSDFSKQFKDRFFDVGIAEQHAVTFSAGLATSGAKPYFAVYSSFLQRAFDQVLHDTAIANLPLKILIDRAGFVGQDGETHQGLFDVAILKCIPNMNIYSPSTFFELSNVIKNSADNNELTAIRYPRGSSDKEYDIDFSNDYSLIGNSKNKCIVTYGRIFNNVYTAQKELRDTDILKLNKIYPINKEIVNLLKDYNSVYFYEETVYSGSVAEHLGNLLLCGGYKGKYVCHNVPDEFVSAMTVEAALKKYGFESESIIKALGE